MVQIPGAGTTSYIHEDALPAFNSLQVRVIFVNVYCTTAVVTTPSSPNPNVSSMSEIFTDQKRLQFETIETSN